MPKISIIIPVYKVEKYLPMCLASVIAQTFTDWEAICVNDGSPDACGNILARYAKKDKRIKVIKQKNQGLSCARNNGIEKAKGKYIYFLDSDDFIHPQLLEICYELAEKEKAQMVSFGFQKFRQGDFISVPNYQLEDLNYTVTNSPLYHQKKHHKSRISVNACTKFYRKNTIKNLRFIPGITMEDYPHTYAVLAKQPRTVILDILLYYYTYNPASISNSIFKIKQIQDYHTGLNSIIEIFNKASSRERNFVKIHLFPNILKQQLKQIMHSPKETQKELYKAFREELSDLKAKGWLTPLGHRITRYLKYRKIMKGIF